MLIEDYESTGIAAFDPSGARDWTSYMSKWRARFSSSFRDAVLPRVCVGAADVFVDRTLTLSTKHSVLLVLGVACFRGCLLYSFYLFIYCISGAGTVAEHTLFGIRRFRQLAFWQAAVVGDAQHPQPSGRHAPRAALLHAQHIPCDAPSPFQRPPGYL